MSKVRVMVKVSYKDIKRIALEEHKYRSKLRRNGIDIREPIHQ